MPQYQANYASKMPGQSRCFKVTYGVLLRKNDYRMNDLIHDSSPMPSLDEITAYINPPARALWSELNQFIQETLQAKPKITYSVSAGKPGWNVKYQKSGKSICTLYPEKDCWVALVVIKVKMAPMLSTLQPALHPLIHNLVSAARPYNKTFWLMIPVADESVLDSLKHLLVLKRNYK